MKIHAMTSIFGISQAAFYGNAYISNQYNQYIPRPGPIRYMPLHPHHPSSGTVPSKPVPAEAKRQVHQGALCGKITDFRWAIITWKWLFPLPVASETTKYTKVHQENGQNWTACDRKTFSWPLSELDNLILEKIGDYKIFKIVLFFSFFIV